MAKPFSADGRELPSSVLKYDQQAVVEAEAALMEEHGKDWGATSRRGRMGRLVAASQRRSRRKASLPRVRRRFSWQGQPLCRRAVLLSASCYRLLMVRYPHVQDLVVQDGWALMSPRGGSGRQEAMQQNEGRAGTRRGGVRLLVAAARM